MAIRKIAVQVAVPMILMGVLTGCDNPGSGDGDERRFSACTKAGGSYQSDFGKWSCTMPAATAGDGRD